MQFAIQIKRNYSIPSINGDTMKLRINLVFSLQEQNGIYDEKC